MIKRFIDNVEYTFNDHLYRHPRITTEEAQRFSKIMWKINLFSIIATILTWLILGADVIDSFISGAIMLSLGWVFIPFISKVATNKMMKKYIQAVNDEM